MPELSDTATLRFNRPLGMALCFHRTRLFRPHGSVGPNCFHLQPSPPCPLLCCQPHPAVSDRATAFLYLALPFAPMCWLSPQSLPLSGYFSCLSLPLQQPIASVPSTWTSAYASDPPPLPYSAALFRRLDRVLHFKSAFGLSAVCSR
jgi:hypothetical protein